MSNMPSPVHGSCQTPASSLRPVRRRTARWDYSEFLEEPMVFTDHTVTYSDAEERTLERGPWANSAVQYSGPVVSPDDWALMRAEASNDGSSPPFFPRGLNPG